MLVFVFTFNLYQAANFYNIDKIKLTDIFFLHSINEQVVDNKVEKKQVYGVNVTYRPKPELIKDSVEIKFLYVVKKDSHRFDKQ